MNQPSRQDTPLATVKHIRAMEQALFERQDSFVVMQQAAQALYDVILKEFTQPRAGQTVHIVLGAGNNAGDGLLAGVLLKQYGFDVCAYQVFDKPFKGDALTAYQCAQAANLPIKPFTPFSCQANDILIEAIFGIGLDRPPEGRAREAIAHLNDCKQRHAGCYIYAVDVPAGILADTGARLGEAVNADTTVTFIADKIGLHTADGKGCAGKVVVKSLQADASHTVFASFRYEYARAHTSEQLMNNTHKGDYGHALIIGGGVGMFGAAALSSVSALKVGAGKSSVYAHAQYASQFHLADTPLYEVMRQDNLSDLSAYSAVVLGVGLGRDEWGAQTFAQTLTNIGEQPLLVDADGLWHLAEQQHLNKVSVITPHEGEAARLLGISVETIRKDKPKVARELATRYRCIAVLKGAGTLISDGQHVWINQTGNVCLATGGTGDVLAGMIGGYLAQGFNALDGARYGVYRHGQAADNYLAQHQDKTMRASDLWAFI